MKKIIFMFCCFIATSCLFTGCEETEVKRSSKEPRPELASAENTRVQGYNLPGVLTAAYENGSTFELSARVITGNLPPQVRCPAGKTLSFRWYKVQIDENGNETSTNWNLQSITGACLMAGNTSGPTTVTQKTTKIKFKVYVTASAPGQAPVFYGDGETNTVTLTRPW